MPYASNVQRYLYAIAKEVGIDPTVTPLISVHVENSWLTIVYVETNGIVYRLKTEYPNPVTGVLPLSVSAHNV